ncbi:MAG: anthranilate phosphoribosyltransferase [Pseudomonadota bacterium]|nr:anthranilate phosphoribosyltransferase [Pseudomonadota bacterium]
MSEQEIINKLKKNQNIGQNESTLFLRSVFNGDVKQEVLTEILILLNKKGITSNELTGFAQSMREVSKKVITNKDVVDNCGTGGDGIGTFNISTTTSFIAAACGVPIAKHGNKAITSKSGSADALTEAGANINLSPEQVAKCIESINLGFMFAPLHHQAMKHVVESRKKIAPEKTIFNLLGPLTNPANSKIQLIGVYDKEKVLLVAESLKNLGTKRAMVIHSEDGLDEISVFNNTYVTEINNSNLMSYTINPNDYGLINGNISDIIVSNTSESLSMMESVFNNNEGPALNICIINAAALLYISGTEKDLKSAITTCRNAVKEGKAKQKFEEFITFTNNV